MEVIFQLFLACFFGFLIGLEREVKRKGAGLQTFSLVCLGACLFGLIAKSEFPSFSGYVIPAIALGVGFLGGGVIFQRESGVFGLTTGAALWATAAIGLAVAFQLYFLAAFSTFLVLLILGGLGEFEKRFIK